jgi:hypothetical protein
MMTPELTTEAHAAVLLHERAKRQALVDRLAGDSGWTRFVSTLFAPIAAGAVFVLMSSSWVREDSRLVDAVLVSALTGVFWLSIGLVQVTKRLQSLTTILQMDGVLERFVGGSR